MRKLFWVALSLIVLGGGAYGAMRFLPRDDAAGVQAPRTAEVTIGPLRVVVAATGVVEPCFKVDVKSKASGTVVAFAAEPGDEVAVGQPLVSLDEVDERRNVRLVENEVTITRAGLSGSQARFHDSEAKLRRTTAMAARSLTSAEEVETATFNRDALGAEVERSRGALAGREIALEEAKRRLADCQIKAPIAGILLTKAVEKGHIIASGITSVSGGTTLCTLADMSRVYVTADIDEADVGRMAPGKQAAISVDAYRDQVFEGRVERIMPLGVSESNVTVFKVKIEVTSAKRRLLLPSMTANVEVLVDERERAVLVPNQALRYRDGDVGVEVVVADMPSVLSAATPEAARSRRAKTEWRVVKRGLTDGESSEVEGVKVGDVVTLGDERPPETPGGRRFGFFARPPAKKKT